MSTHDELKQQEQQQPPVPYQLALRTDVLAFAVKMAETMARKSTERTEGKLPQYNEAGYTMQQAINSMFDKTEQLLDEVKNRSDIDHLNQTAVHLANFAMIIAEKAKLGQF